MSNQPIQTGDVLLGRYRVEAQVGAGSFGAVYRAIDQETTERVAIKALPPGPSITATSVARFQREMKVISALLHRNIIGIYDYGQTAYGELFMVLEYVDGESMDSLVRRGPLPAEEVVSIGEQICSALLLAHHRGIIHRDLKPANIMLVEQRDGYLVKILDFGTAKLLYQLDGEPLEQLTREGMAVGTPRYIAPEQARGEQIGPWSDLYALGLLIYELLTGERAVKYDDIEGAVAAHISPKPLPLPELDQAPRAFHPLVRRLLQKDPLERYQSADALLADLDQLRFELADGPGHRRGRMDPRRAKVVFPDGAPAEPVVDDRAAGALSSEAQKRARAERILAESRSAQPLELDWGDHPRAAAEAGRDDAAGPGQPARGRSSEGRPKRVYFQRPEKPAQWAEAFIAPFIGAWGFLLLGAQLSSLETVPRVLVALSPALVALSWSVLSDRVSWRYSFFRLWILFGLGAVLIAHALGPKQLINALFRGPAWFLNPIRGFPGVELLENGLGWLLRRYGLWLSTIIEAGFDFLG